MPGQKRLTPREIGECTRELAQSLARMAAHAKLDDLAYALSQAVEEADRILDLPLPPTIQ